MPAFTDSKLYVFGDSLSDVGNARIASSGLIPDRNYYQGRFSNGPNYADRLGDMLAQGMKPSRAFGSNYAFGGAQTRAISAQVFNYYENVSATADSEGVYVLWGGGNDLLELLQDPTSSLTIADAITNLEKAIRMLDSMGAATIIVLNQIDMAKLPRIITLDGEIPGTAATASTYSSQFNADLAIMLGNLSTVDGIDTISVDVSSLFNDIVNAPSTYGFSNISQPCYQRDESNPELTGNEIICDSQSDYLFWDSIHPSAAAHTLVATAIEAQLP